MSGAARADGSVVFGLKRVPERGTAQSSHGCWGVHMFGRAFGVPRRPDRLSG